MSTITTAAELDALPVGSVVRSEEAGGTTVAEKNKWSRWDIAGLPISGTLAVTAEDLIVNAPFAVLYRPDQPQRVQPTREDVARALFEWDIAPEHPLPHPLWDDPHSARLRELWLSAADTVLALFDAQPTEAEVRDESEGGAE